jgi:hypothetical protein
VIRTRLLTGDLAGAAQAIEEVRALGCNRPDSPPKPKGTASIP